MRDDYVILSTIHVVPAAMLEVYPMQCVRLLHVTVVRGIIHPSKAHGIGIFVSPHFIYVFVHTEYTSNMAACYYMYSDVSDVTAPRE